MNCFEFKYSNSDFYLWTCKPLLSLLMQKCCRTNCRKLHRNWSFRSWEIWIYSWVMHFFHYIFPTFNRCTEACYIFSKLNTSWYDFRSFWFSLALHLYVDRFQLGNYGLKAFFFFLIRVRRKTKITSIRQTIKPDSTLPMTSFQAISTSAAFPTMRNYIR